jgi:DNA-binding phage protein
VSSNQGSATFPRYKQVRHGRKVALTLFTAKFARKSKLTREATYRMLSASGNPELRSLTAILDAAGLRLSVKPVGELEQ